MSDQNVDEFFKWFAANAENLSCASFDSLLVASLNQKIDSLNPALAWEIGPGREADWSFSLSPDGDESLVPMVRELIARAPKLPGWEFHAFRQPRDANPVFEISTARGVVEIDASDAEYALLRARDRTFDLVVKHAAAAKLDDHGKRVLRVVLLDGLIGEEARMSLIKNVEFVDQFEPKYQGKATKIRFLRSHLTQQVRRGLGDQKAH